ncbi:cell division control-like protein, partial [Trifolium medium]|nr:cell division control-like protein [Trifolium medium]
KIDMDVDSSCEAQATHITGVTLPDAPATEDENSKAVEGENIGSVIENSETAVDTSAAVEIKSIEENGEGQDVANPDEVMEGANKPDNIKEATLLDDMQVDE